MIIHKISGFNLISFLNNHENEINDLGYKHFYDHFKQEEEIIALNDLGLIRFKKINNREELLDFLN